MRFVRVPLHTLDLVHKWERGGPADTVGWLVYKSYMHQQTAVRGGTTQHDHSTQALQDYSSGLAGDKAQKTWSSEVDCGWVRGVTLSGWGSNSRVFLSCRFHTHTELSALALASTFL